MTGPGAHRQAAAAAVDLSDLYIKSVDLVPGKPGKSRVTFLDGVTRPLADAARVVPCFTPGTMIATPHGEMAVETLKIGDRVLTRDNGIQRIEWAGKKRLDHVQLRALQPLRPVQINAGTLGPNIPDRDMRVSPAHRMLIVSKVAQVHFGQSEVLIAAKDMCEIDGIEVADAAYVTYVHFLCQNHELVLADGAWSESFQPGDYSLKGMDVAQRDELFELFPELSTKEGVKAYRAARPSISKKEARVLFKK